MKCPECVKQNLRSTLTLGSSSMTCIGYNPGYYDEDGNFRLNDDPNIYYQEYRCSNGHEFTIAKNAKGEIL